MFSKTEIRDGGKRLKSQKLTTDDQDDLLTLFRLYLKSRAVDFPDLSDRLKNVSDTNQGGKRASKLGALLDSFEEEGFSLADLKGGRSGLQTDAAGELTLKIRYGLASLGYTLPEDFSGNAGNGGGGNSMSGVMLFGSMSVKKDLSGW